jgi:hypothetical protein
MCACNVILLPIMTQLHEKGEVPLSKSYRYLPVSLKTFILPHISSYHFEAKKIMPLKNSLENPLEPEFLKLVT